MPEVFGNPHAASAQPLPRGWWMVEAAVATCVMSPPSCRIPWQYCMVWSGIVWYGVEAAVATCVCCSIMPHSPAAPRWPIVRPSNEN